jgi:hypothetical protein
MWKQFEIADAAQAVESLFCNLVALNSNPSLTHTKKKTKKRKSKKEVNQQFQY